MVWNTANIWPSQNRRPPTHMRYTALMALLTLVWLGLMLPAGAAAASAEPQAIDDPVEAIAPAADPEPAPDAEAASIPEAEVAGPADAGDAAPSAVLAGVEDPGSVSSRIPNEGPELPFTGVDPHHLVLLFLVGSLLVTGGLTAVAYGRATRANA